MIFPDNLPGILFYKVGVTAKVTLPRRPVSYISSSGATDAPQVCPTIPYGAIGWSLDAKEWKPLRTLPPEWLPFLNRQRPSEMDPRPPMKGKA